jgi:hypothetical protein
LKKELRKRGGGDDGVKKEEKQKQMNKPSKGNKMALLGSDGTGWHTEQNCSRPSI